MGSARVGSGPEGRCPIGTAEDPGRTWLPGRRWPAEPASASCFEPWRSERRCGDAWAALRPAGAGGRLIVGGEPASARLAESADPADDARLSPFSPLRRFDEPEAPGPKDGGRSGGGVTEVVPFFVS